ncbi:MAG: hypothetical protein D6722_03385 [Bacteroidetes bacterium]|nr:MAG: hypothetical protein D6722_03385 [Bacteroidota bacterium]
MNTSHTLQTLDLEALLRHYDFDALTPAQQAAVRDHLDEASYRAMRQAICGLRELPDTLQPRPETHIRLQQRLRQQRHAQQRQARWTYYLPVWPVAAAALILFLVARLGPWSPQEKPDQTPQPIMMADSTAHDTTLRRGLSPGEDSVFARFGQETL